MIPKDFCPDISQHIELMRKMVVEVRDSVRENTLDDQFVMDSFGSLMVHFHEMLNRVAGDVMQQVQAQQRDYFAGQALAGVSADSTAPMGCDKDRERIAVWCYQIADAMLKARQQ